MWNVPWAIVCPQVFKEVSAEAAQFVNIDEVLNYCKDNENSPVLWAGQNGCAFLV